MRAAGLWGRLSAFDFPAVLNGYNNSLIQIFNPFSMPAGSGSVNRYMVGASFSAIK